MILNYPYLSEFANNALAKFLKITCRSSKQSLVGNGNSEFKWFSCRTP